MYVPCRNALNVIMLLFVHIIHNNTHVFYLEAEIKFQYEETE